jgi:hypothetical protein
LLAAQSIEHVAFEVDLGLDDECVADDLLQQHARVVGELTAGPHATRFIHRCEGLGLFDER